MNVLKISDIREWLIENRTEYQKLELQEFPPFDNGVYWMYNRLYEFIEYYPYIHKCNKELKGLKSFLNDDFLQFIKWTRANEKLGSQELLMFEVNYFDCKEDIENNILRIHEGLYTERKPFTNIFCFCKIFQLLFWDTNIHETILTEQEQLSIKKEVRYIFKKYHNDKNHN